MWPRLISRGNLDTKDGFGEAVEASMWPRLGTRLTTHSPSRRQGSCCLMRGYLGT